MSVRWPIAKVKILTKKRKDEIYPEASALGQPRFCTFSPLLRTSSHMHHQTLLYLWTQKSNF